MFRRSAVGVFALVIAFVLGAALTTRPTSVAAQPAVGVHGKCVGVAVQGFMAYRAFEDGTVERVWVGPEDGPPPKRTAVGK